MIISGTTLGFVSVGALFLAALVLAWFDRKEKASGHMEKAKFFSKVALGLFIASFLGGVVVTLLSGIKPRDDVHPMGVIRGRAGSPPDSSSGSGFAGPERIAGIGKINQEEFQALQDKVDKDPKDVKARERLGHLYLQMQDFEHVFQMAHEAIQLDPKSLESRVHLGMALHAMGESAQGLAQMDRVLQINPKYLEALLFKGMIQLQSQDAEGAKQSWGQYMKLAKPTDSGYERVKMFLQSLQ